MLDKPPQTPPHELPYNGPHLPDPDWKRSHAADLTLYLGGFTLTAPIIFLLFDRPPIALIAIPLYFLTVTTFTLGTFAIIQIATSHGTIYGYVRVVTGLLLTIMALLLWMLILRWSP